MKNSSDSLKPKAIVLLSGGLDSTLAVRLMLDQGVEVLALNFVSPFCTCGSRKAGSCHLAAEVAREMGVELRVLSKGLDYLKIVEKPRFGHGRGLNPCIDCRIYMLRKAAALMDEVGAGFVVTGEVLGQRPMSQHRSALDRIERESGLAGRILRPLSAGWLEETVPEKEGWVDRSRLLEIQGRSRSEQLALAEREGIEVFGCPSGGCLLTDRLMARRLRDLFRHRPDYGMSDARLVTLGRHFRLRPGLKAILGRDRSENERLESLAGGRPRVELVEIPGPLMILDGRLEDGDRPALGRLLRRYGKKTGPEVATARWTDGERTGTWPCPEPAGEEEIRRWKI